MSDLRSPEFQELYSFFAKVVNGPESRPLLAGETHTGGLMVPKGTEVGRVWDSTKPGYLLSPELTSDVDIPTDVSIYLFNEAYVTSNLHDEHPELAKTLGGATLQWTGLVEGKKLLLHFLDLDISEAGDIELIITDGVADRDELMKYTPHEIATLKHPFPGELIKFLNSTGWISEPRMDIYERYPLEPNSVPGVIAQLGSTVLNAS